MNLKEMVSSPGYWLRGDGPEAMIVFSSRIRLARNLKGFVFPPWAQSSLLKSVAEKLLKAVKKAVYFKNAYYIEIGKLSPLERDFLLERHLISQEFNKGGEERFLVVEKKEILSLMINEEDHLRLQTIFSGLQLRETWDLINKVDDALEENIDYAFSSQWGYLTACPTNTGTGLRASCMLHLPALVISGKINELLKEISKLGLVARGLYGEGTEAQGDFFQISNQVTLGLTEPQIVDNVERIVREVVNQERRMREILLKRNRVQIEDEVGRAYGILTHAHLMNTRTAMNLLSRLRLGVDLNLLPKIETALLNELLFLVAPAHIQIREGKTLAPLFRDELRAKIVREKLNESSKR